MFFNTLSLAEALHTAQERISPLGRSETLETAQALGRVLAREVRADQDLPGFERSSMDGYAVRALDTYAASEAHPAPLALVGHVEMGQDAAQLPALQAQQAWGVSTGGMLVAGADAVVVLEQTERRGDTLYVLKPVPPGSAVIRADEDFKRDERVFSAGHALRAQDVGALLGLGVTQVEVFLPLCVGVISTGDELVPPEQQPAPGQVRDINAYTLSAQLSACHMRSIAYGIVPDQRHPLAQATAQALAECDAVLISGGSSVGVRDATVDVLSGMGQILVHGIRISPGKPTIFALCGDKPVFGLPGNPVSSIVVFEKFAAPLLLKRSGASRLQRRRERVQATLSHSVVSAVGRDDFVRVKLFQQEGGYVAEPLYARSSNISSLSQADGILPVSADREGYARDERVVIERW